VSKLKYYVDKVKSFDLIGVDNGVFAISFKLTFLSDFSLILLMIRFAPICSSAKISSSTVGNCTCEMRAFTNQLV
jgi:hypothetical protein